MNDCQQHYSTVIFGATFGGLGAALAHPEHTLVIERSGAIGQEFIETFNPGSGEAHVLSDAARCLTKDFQQRNIMAAEGGPLHLPAAHAVLCKKMMDAEVELLFLTDILAIQPVTKGYAITLHHASGIQVITAERLLDTTSQRFSSLHPRYVPAGKTLNVLLHSKGEAVMPVVDDERFSLVSERFGKEYILKMAVEVEVDWVEARKQFLQFWQSRSEALRPWTVAAIASAFEYKVPNGRLQLEENWDWLPSGGYTHPLIAFDQGYLLGVQMKERSEHERFETL